jgi:hypothetical protein
LFYLNRTVEYRYFLLDGQEIIAMQLPFSAVLQDIYIDGFSHRRKISGIRPKGSHVIGDKYQYWLAVSTDKKRHFNTLHKACKTRPESKHYKTTFPYELVTYKTKRKK